MSYALNILIVLQQDYLRMMHIYLDGKTGDGTTLLHLLAQFKNSKYLQCIIQKVKSVDEQDEGGDTPLHKSCYVKNYKAAKILLANGCNVNAQNNLGLTPLMILASQKKEVCSKFWNLLLKTYNADTQTENCQNFRALDILRNQHPKQKKIIRLLHPLLSQV